MKKVSWRIITIVFAVVFTAFFLFSKEIEIFNLNINYVKIEDKIFKVELADTDETRSKGLSNHAPLGSDEGMLFIFNYEKLASFWMKEMLFPIHIVWIDKEKKVIGVEKNAQPDSFPNTFSSKNKVKYVLEIPVNSFENVDSIIGVKVLFSCSKDGPYK